MSSQAITEPKPNEPQQKRGIDAIPMTVLGVTLLVVAWFWIARQPAQASADILQLVLAVWAADKVWSLIKGLIGDMRGQDGMEKIATFGNWTARLFASLVFALLAAGVLAIVWPYTGQPVLKLIGINV